jgi:hypothetical protein
MVKRPKKTKVKIGEFTRRDLEIIGALNFIKFQNADEILSKLEEGYPKRLLYSNINKVVRLGAIEKKYKETVRFKQEYRLNAEYKFPVESVLVW